MMRDAGRLTCTGAANPARRGRILMNLSLFKRGAAGLLVSAALVFVAGPVAAGDDIALDGYDTVAYFTMNKAVKGKAAFSAQYLGKTWRFASADHQKLFEADPTRYAPQYGGYCAWAVAAKDDFYPSDPNVFKIVDGKLYLNYDRDIYEKWNKNIPGFIKQGDANYAKSKKPIATEVND
jgi:YHS domain-containing protein